jgi:hypothetical protein
MSLVKSVVPVRSKSQDMLYNTMYYQVRGRKLLKYSQSEFRSEKSKEFINQLNEKKKPTYNGEMSESSQKLLKRKIEIWYDGCQEWNNSKNSTLARDLKKLVFITLTLPSSQFHSDKKIKLLILKPFFRILRDKYKLTNYVWKAESQANGNIHFHVIVDQYIKRDTISETWNKCCEALQYVSEFEKKFKHRNPPSTQVSVVLDKKGLIGYINKYICKSDSYRLIEGAVWKASKSVLSLQYFEFVGDSQIDMNLHNKVEEKKITRYDSDNYTIFDLRNENLEEIITPLNASKYDTYKSLLVLFLFLDPIVTDFRTYCYLFQDICVKKQETDLLIGKKEYPLPVQLELPVFKNIVKLNKYRL